MHTFTLVAGEQVDEQMAPFSVHREVEPYEAFVSDEDIKAMAEHFGLPATDLNTLAGKMQEWEDREGFVRGDRLAYMSTENPHAKHDSYEIGGQWAGRLRLRQARPIRRLFGLVPGQTNEATSAKKSEIGQAALLAHPPAALLFGGEWFESTGDIGAEAPADWRAEFARRFAEIPEGTTLTIVDVHL